MMTFSYNQKKWAMTSALLLVLGFNVSFSKNPHGISALDLASVSEDFLTSEIKTSIGTTNVGYLRTGPKQYLAIISNKNTEGTAYCDDCGLSTHTLNVAFDKNSRDINALNVALLKKLEEEKASSKALTSQPPITTQAEKVVAAVEKKPFPPDEAQQEPEMNEAERNRTFTQKKLDSVTKRCGQEDDKFACLTEGVNEIVCTEQWAKKLDHSAVVAFVRAQVMPQAKMELASAARVATLALKLQAARVTNSYPDMNTLQEYQNLSQTMTSDQAFAKRNAILGSMSHFIETVSIPFEDVRRQFILEQNNLLLEEAHNIQLQKMMASSNPNQAVFINADANARSILLTDLQTRMGQNGINSVNFAISNQKMDPAMYNIYNPYYTTMMTGPLQTSAGTVINNPSQSTNNSTAILIPPQYGDARLGEGRGINPSANSNPTIPQQMGAPPYGQPSMTPQNMGQQLPYGQPPMMPQNMGQQPSYGQPPMTPQNMGQQLPYGQTPMIPQNMGQQPPYGQPPMMPQSNSQWGNPVIYPQYY